MLKNKDDPAMSLEVACGLTFAASVGLELKI